MAITVKRITLWRSEVENAPGVLARTLEPFAEAGANLGIVMGYGYPGNEHRAAVELYPVAGKKPIAAAQKVGLAATDIPVLQVEGDNKPGLGHAMARAMADAGINLRFVMAQVIGKKYTAVFGFENDADARRAAGLIKKAAAAKKR